MLGADEVASYTEVDNTRSVAVMERLGMHCEREILQPGAVLGPDGLRRPAARFSLHALRRPELEGGALLAG